MVLSSFLRTDEAPWQPSSTHTPNFPTMATARSTRVIEQLQDDLDTVQKELNSTHDQLKSYRQAKAQYEDENRRHGQSNTEYRAMIQELMQLIETKQQQLDDTKKDSLSKEDQVKALKDKALESRKQLESLRQREQTLKREREAALCAKELTMQQKEALHGSIQGLDTRRQQELASLQEQLQSLRKHMSLLDNRCKESIQYLEMNLKQHKTEQKLLQEDHAHVHTQLVSASNDITNHTQTDVDTLQSAISKSKENTEAVNSNVLNCRDEMNALVRRIRFHTDQLCDDNR